MGISDAIFQDMVDMYNILLSKSDLFVNVIVRRSDYEQLGDN